MTPSDHCDTMLERSGGSAMGQFMNRPPPPVHVCRLEGAEVAVKWVDRRSELVEDLEHEAAMLLRAQVRSLQLSLVKLCNLSAHLLWIHSVRCCGSSQLLWVRLVVPC